MSNQPLLSRVANSVYWMSRYLERAESVARLVGSTHSMALGSGKKDLQWMPVVMTTGDHEHFAKTGLSASEANVIRWLTCDSENPNSMVSCIYKARENARTVRESISRDLWAQINACYHLVRSTTGCGCKDTPSQDFFEQMRTMGYTLHGVADATMSRTEAWQFITLGRHLERADKTSRILDVKYFVLLPEVSAVGTAIDQVQWSGLLESASALQMYRQRHHRIDPDRIAEFLILDADFPRSVAYCVNRCEQALHAITGSGVGAYSNEAEQLLGRLRSELAYTSINEIIACGLHEYLDRVQTQLNGIDSAIGSQFFALRT